MLEKPIHMTWGEACGKYPDMWVFMVNVTYNGADPAEGDVIAVATDEEEDGIFSAVLALNVPFYSDYTCKTGGNLVWCV